MKSFFNYDNPVWMFIGKLVDVFVLHLIWLICCIPIITFGASTTALYYALMKDVSDEDTHYVKSFFKSFKLNFKKGIPIGLIMLVIGVLLVFCLLYYGKTTEFNKTFTSVMFILTAIFGVLYLFVFNYIFPVFARFDNTIRSLFKTAIYMSIRNLGWTIIMIAVEVIVYVVLMYYLNFLPILILGFGLCVFINSYMLNRILQPYIDEARKQSGDAEEVEEEELNITSEEIEIQSRKIYGLEENETENKES